MQFSPDGSALVVTEKASSTIDVDPVGLDGRAGGPLVSASSGGRPFGFDFDNRGHLLVSNAAGSASSYALTGGAASAISEDGSLTLSGSVAVPAGAAGLAAR